MTKKRSSSLDYEHIYEQSSQLVLRSRSRQRSWRSKTAGLNGKESPEVGGRRRDGETSKLKPPEVQFGGKKREKAGRRRSSTVFELDDTQTGINA